MAFSPSVMQLRRSELNSLKARFLLGNVSYGVGGGRGGGVPDPVCMGAMIGVGPLLGLELEVVRAALDDDVELELGVLGAGAFADETVRVASTALPEPEERAAIGCDRCVDEGTAFAFAVAAGGDALRVRA
jgi:hypothetical protein